MALGANNTSLSTASPLVIEQMKPDGEGKKKRLVLSGRALPFQTVEWKGKLRVKTKWYQGNPVASQQVLGFEHPPTEMKGQFSTRFLSDPVTPQEQGFFDKVSEQVSGSITGFLTGSGPEPKFEVVSEAVVEFFDSPFKLVGERLKTAKEARDALWRFQRDGCPVRVQWDDICRVGLITEAAFDHTRAEDIGWKLTFEWQSDDLPMPAVYSADPDLSQFPEGLLDKLRNFRKTVTAPAHFAGDMLDAINQDIALIESGINELAGCVTDYTNVGAEFLDTVNRMLGIYDSIMNAVNNVKDSIEGVNAEWCATTGRFDDVAAAAEYNYDVLDFANDIGSSVAEQRAALEEFREPRTIGTETVHEGQDLRYFSTKYYETPDHWTDIADYNELEGSDAPVGMTILIPTRGKGA